MTVWRPPSKAQVDVLPWDMPESREMIEQIYRLAGKVTIASGLCLGRCEALCLGRCEVLRSLRRNTWAQSQLDITTSITWGETCRKRKSTMLFFERMRKGHCQSDKHWNCFKGNTGEILKDEVECIYQAILKLNWNELNWWMVNTMAENSIKWCSVDKMQLRLYEIQPKGIIFYNNYSGVLQCPFSNQP